ncbi:MAG: SMC family ATPase [Gemmatimonadales bacterium]
MLLHRLRLVNFRQHEFTDLEFGVGLIGIIGPNGAGKTTLLEAIAYALYGVPATRGTRETLRRRGAPPRSRFEVTLDFSLGIHRYSITRTLTAAELSQDGHLIANSTGAVTDRVTALLGMTRDEFFNTYFTGQKELAVMAAMGATERAQFLSRVLGYEKLREAQDRLRERRTAFRAELTGIEQGLADPAALEAELAAAATALAASRRERDLALAAEQAASARLAALTPDWTAAEARRTAWQALDGERRVAEGKVAAARASFEALDRELASALRARTRLTDTAAASAEWTALTAERESLDKAAAAWGARSKSAARRDQARRRAEELAPQLAALPDAARVDQLMIARADALIMRDAADRQNEERRTRWTQDGQEVRTRLEQFRDRYRELKEQRELIEARGPEGICPTCGRPLGKDFQSLLDLLTRQLEEVAVDGQYLRQRADQLKDLPTELAELDAERQRLEQELRKTTEALGQAQAQLRQRRDLELERDRLAAELVPLDAELAGPAAAYDAMRHEGVRTRLGELEPLRREHDQLLGLATRAETLLADAAAAEQRASGAEGELAALDQRVTSLGWDPEGFAALERSLREIEASLQASRVAVARATTLVEAGERQQVTALSRQADRQAKAEAATRLGVRLGLLQELDRAFTDLRHELNLQLRPELAERASVLLSDLTGGRYPDLDLDESYLPTIVEDGEAKPVISGGEEDVVNLALRLAISQMIAERAGQPLTLLILDEIFGSLDEERRGSVLDLLRALSDRFPQVVLITHVEGMRDAFDRVVRMTYDVEKGVTTATDETPEVSDVAA